MPALVSNRVGSSRGIKGELGITLCPFSSKKRKNAILISSLVMITYDFSLIPASCQREEKIEEFEGEAHEGGLGGKKNTG